MCDTIVAAPAATGGPVMLFGKNSDRQRNEAQAIEHVARAEHTPGTDLRCTYITIPQVAHTASLLLCRPFWLWGAEMGANEHGVVIGNEGLRAKGPPPEENALVGMDLVRLGLERASTASRAIEVIVELLERHGQGGNCGHLTPSYYHNSFIVADAHAAFVLETVGKEWLLESVRDVRAISNRYSIDADAQRVSPGLATLLQSFGAAGDQGYADVIADKSTEHLGFAIERRTCGTNMMNARRGRMSPADIMRILRSHGSRDETPLPWTAECAVRRTICMHAGAEDRPGQTVGSMVSELRPGGAVHWVTGTAAACTSIFKPVLIGVPLPSRGPLLTDRFDPQAIWWRHEQLHRAALRGDFAAFLAAIQEERDALEADFIRRVHAVLDNGSDAERAAVVAQCWREAEAMEQSWHRHLGPSSTPADISYEQAWQSMNERAAVHL